MLRQDDNEVATRVGPGTAMGSLMREYWVPFLLSTELTGPDSDPLRIRLLGESLIAFRDTNGAIGLIAENCPHRGASLFFGRNEECGLRCVYHGWKFDSGGACVDMPNEPPESNFKDKVAATAYPCIERGGLVWTYMGSRRPVPELSNLEWNTVPEGQCYVSKRVAQNNWLQALEGAIDTSHANFLHATLRTSSSGSLFQGEGRGQALLAGDSHPRFESLPIESGVLIAARRNADPDSAYWRINAFLMPFYTLFPAAGIDPPFSGHAWVPIDDENTLIFHFSYHPLRRLTEAELSYFQYGRDGIDGFHPRLDGFLPHTTAAFGAWYPVMRKENTYLLDYAFQKTQAFSGVKSGWGQDSAVQESMGAIYDRTKEHLGSSDSGIIAMRRFVVDAARAYVDQGAQAPAASNPAAFAVRAAAVVLSVSESIWDTARTATQARPGHGFAVV